jgi:hypothetical protein
MIDESEILTRSQVQFIRLFFGGAQLCCTCYQPRQGPQLGCRETNVFDVFSINFTVWCHILCSGGDALSGTAINLKWYQQTQ